MTSNPFDTPAQGAKITDYKGRLLIFTPTEYRPEVDTSRGATDAIVGNLVVVDEKDPTKSTEHKGTMIFQKVLKGQLRPSVESKRPVLGRLATKKAAKAGNSDAWVLDDPTDADVKVALAYWEASRANPFAKAATE